MSERIACGRSHPDERTEEIWNLIRESEGHPTGPMGGCGKEMLWTMAYRCVECGRWFHRECALRHFALSGDDAKAAEGAREGVLA